MNLEVPITPPPQPVLPFKVTVPYKYVVVRGNGDNKIFDSLYGSSPSSAWNTRGTYPGDMTECLLIPLDMLTAVALGIVRSNELELPEHLKAFVNMIKP